MALRTVVGDAGLPKAIFSLLFGFKFKLMYLDTFRTGPFCRRVVVRFGKENVRDCTAINLRLCSTSGSFEQSCEIVYLMYIDGRGSGVRFRFEGTAGGLEACPILAPHFF